MEELLLQLDPKFLQELVDAINEHATRKWYDEGAFRVACGGILVSLCAIYFTYRIYKKQIKISKEQNELLGQQNKISERQIEITEQQNSIAQFEEKNKSYEIHQIFRCDAKKGQTSFRNTNFETRDKNHLWAQLVHCFMSSSDIEKNYRSGDETRKLNNSIISPCIFELRKIKRLFSLDKKELAILDEIIPKLESSYDDIVDNNISFDDLKTKFKNIFQLVAESTILETMKKQLNNN